jgi:hypothetical protein
MSIDTKHPSLFLFLKIIVHPQQQYYGGKFTV